MKVPIDIRSCHRAFGEEEVITTSCRINYKDNIYYIVSQGQPKVRGKGIIQTVIEIKPEEKDADIPQELLKLVKKPIPSQITQLMDTVNDLQFVRRKDIFRRAFLSLQRGRPNKEARTFVDMHTRMGDSHPEEKALNHLYELWTKAEELEEMFENEFNLPIEKVKIHTTLEL